MSCFLFHNWYYGAFQTGKRSKWTNDHIGVNGRSCLNCETKQIRKKVNNKWIYLTVKNFHKEDIEKRTVKT